MMPTVYATTHAKNLLIKRDTRVSVMDDNAVCTLFHEKKKKKLVGRMDEL